jgi:hypothetical protein
MGPAQGAPPAGLFRPHAAPASSNFGVLGYSARFGVKITAPVLKRSQKFALNFFGGVVTCF